MSADASQIGSIEVIPLIFFLQEVEKAPGPSTWNIPYVKQKFEEMKIVCQESKSTGSLINWKGDDIEDSIEGVLEINNRINDYSLGILDGIGKTHITKEPGIIGIDMLLGIYNLLTGNNLNIDSMLPEDRSDQASIDFDKIFGSIIVAIRKVLTELKLFEEDTQAE